MTSRAPACSDQSVLRGDPMYGTASAGAHWLLLELCGPWGPSAFLDSPQCIDPKLGLRIVRRAESAGLRIAAIRRHGRRPDTKRWRWFVAHCEPGAEALLAGEVDGPEGYLELALDGSGGTAVADPLVAVCAHGKHDRCCAVRGRGAVAAIAAAYPEFTWECSHLGGDRFAATMLILPEGLCYGRVDLADSSGLVAAYLEGRVENAYLRGRTSLPHAVQAAQYFVRQRFGDDRIASWPPLQVHQGDGVVSVELASATGRVTVGLRERMSEPLLSQCRATAPGRVRVFELAGIEESGEQR